MKQILSFFLILVCCCSCQPLNQEHSHEETQLLMDTVCAIRAGGDNAQAAISSAFEKVKEIQDAVNLYSDSSTISRFNRAKAGEVVPLDNHSAEILKVALSVCENSDGAFDITVAPLSTLWPFHGEESPQPPNPENIQKTLPLVGYDKLRFSAENQTLSKTVDGVSIDLGGAAKGYAADCAAKILQEAGVSYALLNFGGTVVAVGKNPNRKDGSWQIGLQKPFDAPDAYGKVVTIESQNAVVTSGIYQRGFSYNGAYYHHILNPKTGYPADSGLTAVTITAPSALLADCLSTACLVAGSSQAENLAKQFGVSIELDRTPVPED